MGTASRRPMGSLDLPRRSAEMGRPLSSAIRPPHRQDEQVLLHHGDQRVSLGDRAGYVVRNTCVRVDDPASARPGRAPADLERRGRSVMNRTPPTIEDLVRHSVRVTEVPVRQWPASSRTWSAYGLGCGFDSSTVKNAATAHNRPHACSLRSQVAEALCVLVSYVYDLHAPITYSRGDSVSTSASHVAQLRRRCGRTTAGVR